MENNIPNVIRKISQNSDEVYAKVAQVLTIDSTNKTVDVKPVDGSAEVFNVRLQAESETGGLIIYPKIGSMVLVVFLNKNNAVVVNASAIDAIEVDIRDVSFKIDKDGFLLKKQNETLKKLMGDLIGAIKTMKFTVATTGSASAQSGQTILLQNIASFTSIENRFNQLLK